MGARFDVFLSYSSTDDAWVRRLAEDLKGYGVSVWLDRDEIRPGDLFAEALALGIEQSRTVAIVISPASMAPGWVKEAYNRALTLAQRQAEPVQLIPVLLRTATLPGFIEPRRQVDFREPDAYAERVAELVWGITGEKPASVRDLPENLPPLPRAYIPKPAPLPPGSRMPMGRNELFVGREAQLHELAEALQVQGAAVIGQVASVTGLGGIGKTQLAAEFVHRYGQFFTGGVFWLSFADPASVRAEIAQCGGPGHLGLWTHENMTDIDMQVDWVRSAFHSPEPRLLVFDNCEDEKLLDEWRPKTGGSRVLVTSRRSAFSAHLGVRTFPLDVLPRAESLTLLRSFMRSQPSDDADEATLDATCAELGDLPLALHLAGSFLARYRTVVTPVDYLVQLRSPALLDHPSLQGRGATTSPTNHELHVGKTFALSWDRLDPTDPVDAMARALLQRAACLAPGEPIPPALLMATLGVPEGNFDATLAQTDALRRLLDLGLLEKPEPETYRIHRLVTTYTRQTSKSVSPAAPRTWVRRLAHRLLRVASQGEGGHTDARAAVEQTLMDEAKRVNVSGYPARLLAWQPHLRSVTDAAIARKDIPAARLCSVLGYHLYTIGDVPAARLYLEHALTIFEKQLGLEHPDTVASLNNLALLLHAQGNLAEARPLFEHVLTIFEKYLGPEHPDTATSLNNLALLLHAQGEFDEARPLHEHALAIWEKQLGPEHPLTAQSLNNLAGLLHDQGALAEARPLHERALAIREKQLGPEHPLTAQSLNNLAKLLRDQGALGEARPLYERALAIREKQLGPEHPLTAQSLNNLAGLLLDQGTLVEVPPLHERALAIREKRLGSEHPDTAESLNNLAALLHDQGALAEARPLYERALAIREKQLGPAHPDTAQSLDNLATLLQDQGALADARALYEGALAFWAARLGPDHPHTQLVRDNLQRLPKP